MAASRFRRSIHAETESHVPLGTLSMYSVSKLRAGDDSGVAPCHSTEPATTWAVANTVASQSCPNTSDRKYGFTSKMRFSPDVNSSSSRKSGSGRTETTYGAMAVTLRKAS
jgi:hypothetical protein